MDCKLQVFKHDASDGNLSRTYRFAVVDNNCSKSYPANFVCMLPLKVDQSKGKIGNVFGELFGDKGLDLAMYLLKDALKRENDGQVKAEIERRLRLIDPKQVSMIRCSGCKKMFQPVKVRKYKQNFCKSCLNKKYPEKIFV
jgi:hypothetical protein